MHVQVVEEPSEKPYFFRCHGHCVNGGVHDISWTRRLQYWSQGHCRGELFSMKELTEKQKRMLKIVDGEG
jgi:hypothetical protein